MKIIFSLFFCLVINVNISFCHYLVLTIDSINNDIKSWILIGDSDIATYKQDLLLNEKLVFIHNERIESDPYQLPEDLQLEPLMKYNNGKIEVLDTSIIEERRRIHKRKKKLVSLSRQNTTKKELEDLLLSMPNDKDLKNKIKEVDEQIIKSKKDLDQ